MVKIGILGGRLGEMNNSKPYRKWMDNVPEKYIDDGWILNEAALVAAIEHKYPDAEVKYLTKFNEKTLQKNDVNFLVGVNLLNAWHTSNTMYQKWLKIMSNKKNNIYPPLSEQNFLYNKGDYLKYYEKKGVPIAPTFLIKKERDAKKIILKAKKNGWKGFIVKPDYSKTEENIEGIFNPKEKNLLEKNGTKFNKFWTKADSIYSESASINTTSTDLTIDQDIPEKSSMIIETDLAPLSKRWSLPSLDILTDSDEGGISREDIKKTSDIIKTTFAEYRIEVEVEKVRPGPTVTMYGIEPGWVRKYKRVRVKDEKGNPKLDKNGKQIIAQEEDKTRISVDNILRREKDLSLALKTPSLRIETPVMGESLLGIEVPNPNPSIVSLKRVMGSKTYGTIKTKSPLPVALGRGSDGDEVVFDLARMPHLLIAGATGSGKSVCMNAIISCLIMERTPSELQMLLVDPKRVELTPYNGIPHLITPVVVETDRVVNLLKGLIKEMMDKRWYIVKM